MANLGLSNSAPRSFEERSERRRAAATPSFFKRRSFETALHAVLFAAAFIFVAAIVCGVGI
jgi:hypothetical protein